MRHLWRAAAGVKAVIQKTYRVRLNWQSGPCKAAKDRVAWTSFGSHLHHQPSTVTVDGSTSILVVDPGLARLNQRKQGANALVVRRVQPQHAVKHALGFLPALEPPQA